MIRTLLAAITLCVAACAPTPEAATPVAPPPVAGDKEIALTFDDAPLPDSAFMTGEERTRRLIAALRAANVEGATIFATTQGAETPSGRARLQAYADAGLFIANHTRTHRSANAISAAEFLADAQQADAMIRTMPNFRPWLRFPYLHAGETVEKRDALRAGLRAMGYQHGYITVDAWDWYLAGKVDEAVAAGRHVDWDAVRDVYVEAMVRSAAHADTVSRARLGRPIRQVFLLHENDLAAQFIDDLAAALRADGWTIISSERAFQDPIATIDPETLNLGGGQLKAIASVAGGSEEELDSGLTNEAGLDALLARALH
jgi:peptidoglycan/xylan/chitin deacetylase (PgdA/CDA1 family)